MSSAASILYKSAPNAANVPLDASKHMTGLRVIQVVLSLSPGGTERLVVEIVRRTRGYCDSIVCCLDEMGDWGVELAREGIPVVALARREGFRPSLGWRIARLVPRHGTTVLHCHHYTPFIYGGLAAALTGSGLVFTEHGRLSDSPPSLKRRLVNPVIGRLGGAIFAVSSHLRDHMVAEGFPASRVSMIHNGIDPGTQATEATRRTAREALGLPVNALVIGTAARLDPVKSLGTLLEAFKEFRAAGPVDSHLVIFGDGPDRAALTAQSVALGLQECVRFTGHRADVRQLTAGARHLRQLLDQRGYLAHHSRGDGCRAAVVATACRGHAGGRRAGSHGSSRAAARATSSWPSRCRSLPPARAQRHAFGVAGRERVLQHFTIDRMVADYVAQYRRAARKDT